jgi:hypothetical protein
MHLATFLLLTSQLLIFSGCAEYERWRNGPPEINTFNVPKDVRYGESVELKVGVSDPEDDTLTYLWDVSDGTLIGESGPEIQWTAPELPDTEIAPDQTVTVYVSVRDDGEETVSKSASIIVFSKSYRVAEALSTAHLNRTLWLSTGCFFPLIGPVVSQWYQPFMPTARVLGKSPEYVAFYYDAYKIKTKKLQFNWALGGCLVGASISAYLLITLFRD